MTLCNLPNDLLWKIQEKEFIKLYQENFDSEDNPDENFKDRCEEIVLGLGFSKNQFEVLYRESTFQNDNRRDILSRLYNRCGLILTINEVGVNNV